MRRRIAPIRVKPRRKARSLRAPEHAVMTAALTADQVALKAQLHEQAAQSVSTTLTRMQRRTQEAARATPELEPFLTAYFEAAGAALLRNTLQIVNEPPRPPLRVVPPPRRTFPRFSIRRLIPVRSREEQPDGAA